LGEAQEIETGTPQLQGRLEAHVAVLTLARPEARNALTWEMKDALAALLARLARDPDVRCVLLTGAGGAFCAGGDTKRMKSDGRPPSQQERVARLRGEHEIPWLLHTMEKPTLVSLPGAAAGAGLGIALAADLRIAAESAFVTTAYARLGLSGDYGSSWFLTKLVGPARARELMFSAARVDAQECLRLGLVNRVVPDAELAAAAFAWARELASGPPVALRFMKENLNRALTDGLRDCLEREAEHMVAGAMTEDYLEAVAAFSEKRPPVFRGR
jgi:2-(1,2-epoxy-1,2-dihydrophenyl)acetyl-CoA isomerase